MDKAKSASDTIASNARTVFVSYATTDRKRAMALCKAIEARGTRCWISARDVAPGENYQEAIVRSIRDTRALVLVFSRAANNSDEIKKELSLASRYRLPVLALRIEDVEPGDAFAYELSTRQWIDAFEGWDKSIDALVGRIAGISGTEPVPTPAAAPARRRLLFGAKQSRATGVMVGLLLLAMVAGAWWLWPRHAAAHSLTVRLAGFQLLSADLPSGIRNSVDAEIAAAFNADGVVGVSTASAITPGKAPAYALGGTIQRNGEQIRVITQMTNERSGATLWSDTFNYDGHELTRIPRHIAVDAGNVVRCGLFGASTYRKPLPDDVLRDYMQFCQGHWDPNLGEGRKALVPAQRVVAAAPDFSWGWAAVAGAYWKVALNADTRELNDQARASGREAADHAIAIDSKNSEALYIKAVLLDRHDWIARESLFKRAVAAKRLDCGCEHHQYGWMLANVGRITDALDQLHQADDMLALYVYTPLTLAEVLVAAGKLDMAKQYYNAAIDLAPNADFAAGLEVVKASETGDIKSLLDPGLPISPDRRAGLLAGFRALNSGDAEAKAQAVRMLVALPNEQKTDSVARLLARLGADDAAFDIARRLASDEYPGPSIFWHSSMRGTLSDPRFPVIAAQLGLFDYWRKTHVRPDVCNEKAAPPFCKMI